VVHGWREDALGLALESQKPSLGVLIAMTQTQTKDASAPKAAASHKPHALAARPTSVIDTTVKLSDEVLETVEKSHRVAIDAVRKFAEIVDHAVPAFPHGEGPSRQQEIVDSALEMADRLVQTQYDFIRKVIDSTAGSLGRSDDAK
jgi:hypothetical protein